MTTLAGAPVWTSLLAVRAPTSLNGGDWTMMVNPELVHDT